jgi:hypothetical protein
MQETICVGYTPIRFPNYFLNDRTFFIYAMDKKMSVNTLMNG